MIYSLMALKEGKIFRINKPEHGFPSWPYVRYDFGPNKFLSAVPLEAFVQQYGTRFLLFELNRVGGYVFLEF